MVSNSHEDGQIVVSKEITLTSPPRNTYGSNNAESSSSKTDEQLKSSVQHDNDNAKNKGVVAENLPSCNENDLSVKPIAVDNENELSHVEQEIHICDACGDQGIENLLVICSKCKIGAEHIYCMVVKVADPHKEWICYDCTNDTYGMGEGEETGSIERKSVPFFDFFEMEERNLSRKQLDLLNNGLNIDPNVNSNKDMNEEPSSRKRRIGPSIDGPKMAEETSSSQADLLSTNITCKTLWFDLNKDHIHNPDFDEDPNRDLNVDP